MVINENRWLTMVIIATITVTIIVIICNNKTHDYNGTADNNFHYKQNFSNNDTDNNCNNDNNNDNSHIIYQTALNNLTHQELPTTTKTPFSILLPKNESGRTHQRR